MWTARHGCALPLLKRHPNKCGVHQHGPRPSQMFRALQKDPTLLWIYLSAPSPYGAETVADFLLARFELGVRAHEVKPTMRLVRQCQAWMEGNPGAKDPLIDLCLSREAARARQEQKDAEAQWAKRRTEMVRRDEERQRGPFRQHLESSKGK